MAESIDCFNIGSIVNCKTCFNDELQGEVLAYDSEINTILLKTTPSSGKPSSCDILFVNLNFASQVKVVREAPASPPPPLPSLNLTKLSNRVKKSIEDKSKLLQAMQSGCTVEGQRLFLTIGKTIDEVSWSGPNIIVMSQVLIAPPYHLENVIEYKDANAKEINTKAVAHVRKIVEKFYKDQQGQQILTLNNGKASSGSPKCASPTSSAPPSAAASQTASLPPQTTPNTQVKPIPQ